MEKLFNVKTFVYFAENSLIIDVSDAYIVCAFATHQNPHPAGLVPSVGNETHYSNFAHVFFRTIHFERAQATVASGKDIVAERYFGPIVLEQAHIGAQENPNAHYYS